MAILCKINEKDNVAVAVENIAQGDVIPVNGKNIRVKDDVPAGHKIAVRDIPAGGDIVKYGFPIGTAREAIAPGSWVHTHNVRSKLGNLLEYAYEPEHAEREELKSESRYEFLGYKRQDGAVGIRNEVWIIPTVGCVNGIARSIEEQAQRYKEGSIDGIYAYSHPHGCSQLGDDQLHTQKILSGLVHSPNAGAVLVVGLGCENNQISLLQEVIGSYDPERVKFLVCQEVEDEIAAGVELVKELCGYAGQFQRERCDASHLTIGLKCGGSDGFSGITANPLVGEISNRLIGAGGTSILTEVPEMFGAETLLMNRSRNEKVFAKTVALINNFKSYFLRYGEKVDENPSPGNKAGGITTLEDKSLGCVQKGGRAIVEDVLEYGDRVTKKGLVLLAAPGNDLVAANTLAAAGAQLVLFTTGRGTPFACPVPTLKIASNSRLAEYKKNWIDFDAGPLVHGERMDEAAERFFRFILDVASGRAHAKSEALDKHELAIFKDGVTL
ncbi:d-galactarate dehydratase / altronate hydrolase c terminus [Lucifera butyrica]|uniref:D-galactarate dehydratase / altronate hydrolase c terminus n=1 Tax=Lucifera butyrica TaxID=1351585 RepID=A0A498RI44_9FIRM|nr:altronate dehydratase family protein [Lucifera butyrica]VBB09783.1 d-galactarate dehydratase / altronate hydrolase c terminus [Lucifera butyrica]